MYFFIFVVLFIFCLVNDVEKWEIEIFLVDLIFLKYLFIVKMYLDIVYFEFVKVYLNIFFYLEMIWNLEENFYDFVLWYIYDVFG